MTETSRNADAQRFIEPLPPKPNLDKQRKLAKTLALDYWRGDAEAVARVQALHPKPPAADKFALADAQLVIARGYGFESWARLKHKIDSLTKSPAELFVAAVRDGDVEGVRGLLDAHPELAARINEPLFDFKQPAIQLALGNLAMLDLLIAHGADINAKSDWEMGGFGILENATPEQLPALLERGAKVDVWSAAKFDMADRLRAFLTVRSVAGECQGRRRQAAAALCGERGDRGAPARPRRRDRCARRRPPFDAGAISRQRAAGRRPLPARARRALRPAARGGARRPSIAFAGISTRTRTRSGCG